MVDYYSDYYPAWPQGSARRSAVLSRRSTFRWVRRPTRKRRAAAAATRARVICRTERSSSSGGTRSGVGVARALCGGSGRATARCCTRSASTQTRPRGKTSRSSSKMEGGAGARSTQGTARESRTGREPRGAPLRTRATREVRPAAAAPRSPPIGDGRELTQTPGV